MTEGFTKAAKGLAELSTMTLRDVQQITSGLSTDFQYALYLKSDMVPEYRLKVLTFGYDVELMPVKIVLNNDIAEELHGKKLVRGDYITIETEEKFRDYLSSVFRSNHFVNVVSGLLKLAQKK